MNYGPFEEYFIKSLTPEEAFTLGWKFGLCENVNACADKVNKYLLESQKATVFLDQWSKISSDSYKELCDGIQEEGLKALSDFTSYTLELSGKSSSEDESDEMDDTYDSYEDDENVEDDDEYEDWCD